MTVRLDHKVDLDLFRINGSRYVPPPSFASASSLAADQQVTKKSTLELAPANSTRILASPSASKWVRKRADADAATAAAAGGAEKDVSTASSSISSEEPARGQRQEPLACGLERERKQEKQQDVLFAKIPLKACLQAICAAE